MNKHYKWYVYELINPIDGKTFYVGKGSGNRIEHHEKEALKEVCSKKCNKIKHIWSLGFEIHRKKNALFWDEQAAYDHETDLIAEIGLQNLTNIMPGGQTAFDRRLVERSLRQQNEPRPFKEYLAKLPAESAFFDRFAEWFKAGLHNGGTIVATAKNDKFKFHATITEVAYNKILPMFWSLIKADDESLQIFTEKMKYHKVELCYGGA